MEIGNLGRDIASSTTIYLRPGSLPEKMCIGGVNNGQACPPAACTGGVCSNVAPRFYKYATYAESVLDLGTGRLCLNPNGAGVWDCRGLWPSTGGAGDTNWQTTTVGSMTDLQPISGSPVVDSIRAGTLANPVPSANGTGLDVETNANAPAVILNGFQGLTTGYYNSGLGSTVGGRVDIFGKLRALLYAGNDLEIGANGGVTPYNAANVYSQLNNIKTHIDADTFDGTTPMLFPTNGNLFWKAQTAGPSTIHRMCLRTTSGYLCVGGTNPGTNAGTPCPNGNNTGPDATKCIGGATCQTMCSTTDSICAASPAAKHCVSTGAACVTSLNCPGGDACVRGHLVTVAGGTGVSPTCTQNCQTVCAGSAFDFGAGGGSPAAGNNIMCDGQAGAGTCSAYGEYATADSGQTAALNNAYGSCQPFLDLGGGVFSWRQICDCYLSAPKNYLRANPPGTGGDLCSKPLTAS